MKKSVIAFIGAIYLLSIFAVGILGIKSKVYNEKVYIDDIEVLNEEAVKQDDGTYVIMYDFETNKDLIIQRRILPDTATNKVVEYVYDEQKEYVKVDKWTGVVKFIRRGRITVYLTAKDGSGVVKKVIIYAV